MANPNESKAVMEVISTLPPEGIGSVVVRVAETFVDEFLSSHGGEITEQQARLICDRVTKPQQFNRDLTPGQSVLVINTPEGEMATFDRAELGEDLYWALRTPVDENRLDPLYAPIDFRVEAVSVRRKLFGRNKETTSQLAAYHLEPPSLV